MQSIFLQRSSCYLGGSPFKDRRRISEVSCLLVNTIDTFCVTRGADPEFFLGGGGGGGFGLQKIYFGLKIRGERAPWAPPLEGMHH